MQSARFEPRSIQSNKRSGKSIKITAKRENRTGVRKLASVFENKITNEHCQESNQHWGGLRRVLYKMLPFGLEKEISEKIKRPWREFELVIARLWARYSPNPSAEPENMWYCSWRWLTVVSSLKPAEQQHKKFQNHAWPIWIESSLHEEYKSTII